MGFCFFGVFFLHVKSTTSSTCITSSFLELFEDSICVNVVYLSIKEAGFEEIAFSISSQVRPYHYYKKVTTNTCI